MPEQKITPLLMFSGKAEEAIRFYTSIFEKSQIESVFRQENGHVMHATFTLNGQSFMAIDNSNSEGSDFTPAMSLFVTCKTESEIAHLFNRLSEDGTIVMDLAETPFAAKFAWVHDKFGVSWQLNLEKSGSS